MDKRKLGSGSSDQFFRNRQLTMPDRARTCIHDVGQGLDVRQQKGLQSFVVDPSDREKPQSGRDVGTFGKAAWSL